MIGLRTDGGSRWSLGLGVIVLLGVIGLPAVADNFTLFMAATALAMGLYAASYDVLYGYTGLLSFGHSVFYGAGAYAAALAIMDHGIGTLPAVVIAPLFAGLVAVILGVMAVRVKSHAFVIVTILLALMAHLWATSWSDVTGGTDGIAVIVPAVSIPGLGEFLMIEPVFRYYFVLAILLVSLAFLWKLVNSPVGLVFQMIRDNEERAEMLGYNTSVYKLASFAVAGMFAGLGGALFMFTQGFVSAADFGILLAGDAVIITIIGGRATLLGPVIGAALIRFSELQISEYTNAYPLFIGILVILIVLIEPDGIFGMYERLKRRIGRGRTPATDGGGGDG